MSDREIVENFKKLIAQFSDTGPLITKLQVAIVARDLEEIRRVTVEVCDAQLLMLRALKEIPGTDPRMTDLQIGQVTAMRVAHVENDPTAIAIAYAEGLGLAYQQMMVLLGNIAQMMDEVMGGEA